MRVHVLSSGSSGNALLFECARGGRILVDAGVGPRNAAARMRALGSDLFPRGVDGIVVTHEHGDHIAQLEPLARALRAPVHLHRGIAAPRVRNRFDVREYDVASPFTVGTFTVRALAVPHDAPQVALSIESPSGLRFAVATDLGHVPRGLPAFLGSCDGALVEANYCPELLAVGPYPPRLRYRIRGGLGHLANEQTADLAAHLVGTRLAKLHLGHISRANNTPERALAIVASRCRGLPVDAIPHGAVKTLHVTPGARASSTYEQLGLAFA